MKKLALIVTLFALFATGRAEAVPQTVTFSGRLTTSTGPVTGSVNLTFKLFDAATGGTATWTEVRNGVGASNGLVFVDLGAVTTLDSSLFGGSVKYLEITVGTETLAPRLAINSVPYAMHTEESDTLGGTITAADVITSAAGTGGVTATKTGNALAVSLTTAGCSNGQVYKFNGTTFACANDATGGVGTITGVTAGNGLSGGGTTGTVSLAVDTSVVQSRVTGNCPSGSSIASIGAGGGVTCESDDVGLTVEADGVVGNEVVGATNGTLIRSGAGTAANPWTLGIANGGVGTAQLATGITVDGTFVAGRTIVNASVTIDGNSGGFTWNPCPSGSGVCYSKSVSTSCPVGTTIIGGGCQTNNAVYTYLNSSYPSGNGWFCNGIAWSQTGNMLTSYSICARIQ